MLFKIFVNQQGVIMVSFSRFIFSLHMRLNFVIAEGKSCAVEDHTAIPQGFLAVLGTSLAPVDIAQCECTNFISRCW